LLPRASVPAAAEASAPALTADAFDRALAALGPFEPKPQLAIAVSGGADSLALALCADTWVRARGGQAIGLIVDHGLRVDSGAEARRVVGWLAKRGMPAHTLAWRGAKPAADIQATARIARYALLAMWCRRAGVLHLLVAHHRDDQAETLLLNLARGAGVDGLGAMPPLGTVDGVRLLRPLLGFAKAALVALLRDAGQPWIEDPSNAAARFRRTSARTLSAALLAPLAPGEVDAERIATRLAATASRMARARAALDAATAQLLAIAVEVSPHGFVMLDAAAIRAAPEEVALRALARALMCVSGSPYPPRHERLHRAWVKLGSAQTLGGCRLAPVRGRVLVWREAAAIGDPIPLRAGIWTLWDGRFRVRVRRMGCRIAAFEDARIESNSDVPWQVRPTLPAVWDRRGLVAVPALGFRRGDAPMPAVLFHPPRALAPLAMTQFGTMYR
jgi:tRNA(Ile)-lysidine synthase